MPATATKLDREDGGGKLIATGTIPPRPGGSYRPAKGGCLGKLYWAILFAAAFWAGYKYWS